ncbi:MAG: hypothetical protein AAB895_02120, partial [Patescibacteria group bacterium]
MGDDSSIARDNRFPVKPVQTNTVVQKQTTTTIVQKPAVQTLQTQTKPQQPAQLPWSVSGGPSSVKKTVITEKTTTGRPNVFSYTKKTEEKNPVLTIGMGKGEEVKPEIRKSTFTGLEERTTTHQL